MRPAGSLTGLVGDLALGLITGEGSSELGFFAGERDFLGVVGLAMLARAGALAVSVVCCLGAWEIVGDLGALEAVFPVVGIVDVLGLVECVPLLAPPFVAGLEASLLGCTAAAVVGSAAVSLVLVSSSSVTLSGFELGTISGVCVPFLGEDLLGGVGCPGDSGIGSLARFVLNAAAF